VPPRAPLSGAPPVCYFFAASGRFSADQGGTVSSPIFISYASTDQAVAETICDAFQESIVRAIRAARVMLLVFTSNANNSDEIKKELVLAGRNRVTVLPLRVEDVVPNDAFAYEFATRQWIDLFKDWEREIDRLGAQIDVIIAASKGDESTVPVIVPKPGPRFTPAQKSPSKSSAGPLVAAAALILAALGAGGLFLHMRAGPVPASPVTPPPVAVTLPPPAANAQASTLANPPAAAPIPSPAPVAPPPAAMPLAVQAQSPPAPPQPSTSASGHGFEGAWAITFTCPPAGGALGYSYRVAAQITDGMLHGEKGEKGKPGWLTIDGKIGADGSLNNLYVDSLVGASQFAVGNVARGTEFGYHVAGKLNGASGTGSRIEGRPCTLDFAKQ
jgi:hypothetical protein